MQGMSLGGNAGVDLMALLNSGQGGMRIGGNQGPPPNHGPQQGSTFSSPSLYLGVVADLAHFYRSTSFPHGR